MPDSKQEDIKNRPCTRMPLTMRRNGSAAWKRLPRRKIGEEIIDARTVLATYFLNLNHHIEARNAVEPVLELAVGLNYQKGLSGIYTAMGLFHICVEEDYKTGSFYLKQASEISEKMHKYLVMWLAQYQLGCHFLLNYQFKESMGCLKTSLVMSQISKNLTGMAHSKSALAMNYNFQNRPDLALALSEEALEAALESEDAMGLQPAYTVMGQSLYYKGDLQEAERNLIKALAYYEKAGIVSWGAGAAGWLGWMYYDLGYYDKAKLYHQQCTSIMEETTYFPSWINCHKLWMKNYGILSKLNIDIEKLETLINNHQNNRLAMCESFGTQCIAEIYLNIDDQHMTESEFWITRAIEFNTKQGTHWELARDYALYADWYKKKGETLKAKEQLIKAIDLFRECGADGWVTMTEEKLAQYS